MRDFDEKRFSEETVMLFADGEYIFCESDDSREMFIVRKGEVVVTKRTARGEIELARLHKGDFLGEMSLLESLPRSASARAEGAVELLAIQPGGFLLKIRRDPTFAFEMMQTLSRRLRITNEKLLSELNNPTASSESMRTILQSSEFSRRLTDETKPQPTPFEYKKTSSL